MLGATTEACVSTKYRPSEGFHSAANGTPSNSPSQTKTTLQLAGIEVAMGKSKSLYNSADVTCRSDIDAFVISFSRKSRIRFLSRVAPGKNSKLLTPFCPITQIASLSSSKAYEITTVPGGSRRVISRKEWRLLATGAVSRLFFEEAPDIRSSKTLARARSRNSKALLVLPPVNCNNIISSKTVRARSEKSFL